MKLFRIAFGKASCRAYTGNNQNIKSVCKLVFEKLNYLKALQFSQLLNWKESETDISQVDGKEVILTAYRKNNQKDEFLVVVQAFYPYVRRSQGC